MATATMTFSYVHSTPGRMRIRVPALRGEESRYRRMEADLAARPGITHVTANPLTGSVLILFDACRMEDRDVLDALGAMGLRGDLITSSVSAAGDATPSLAEISTRVGTVIGKELVKAALSRAVGGSPASLLLLFL